MSMLPKLLIWGTIFYGTLLLNKNIIVPQHMEILYLIVEVGLFCVYLALLYWEIRVRIKKEATQKQLRWVGFYFTFGVGFIWGMAFSLGLGRYPLFYDPFTFFGTLSSGIVWGIIIGIVGMAITQFMVLFIFRQPEQQV